MTMTHKEALIEAVNSMPTIGSSMAVMEAAIRAYIEARGLVLVPKNPTRAMWEAVILSEDGRAYQDMLAAAPDPFAQEERA